ncbi:hypothetical protein NFI96_010071 [Prochilodus magdalenae]|nr:hypothetical protein NFI96_010071 [Prochilodus magdalenae]
MGNSEVTAPVDAVEEENQNGALNRSVSGNEERFRSLEDIDVSADGSPALPLLYLGHLTRWCAPWVWSATCSCCFFVRARQDRRTNKINFFILNLAVTDFQFVLTLPFWAVDTALDFSWPFGDAMCKIVLSVTVMNMYASVFFLTAMSVTRYRSVASALTERASPSGCSARGVGALLWALATVATAPTSIFSTVTNVAGEKLCLLRFPDGQHWLAVYHLQKILVAFVVPMAIVCVSYLLLLRLVRRRGMRNNTKRRTQVTRSVTLVVLSFFLCWMPNHAVTLWGVLVKFNAVRWDRTYYVVHTYVFPLTVCLAHANSCLNPVIYCMTRRDFRKKLKELWLRD